MFHMLFKQLESRLAGFGLDALLQTASNFKPFSNLFLAFYLDHYLLPMSNSTENDTGVKGENN